MNNDSNNHPTEPKAKSPLDLAQISDKLKGKTGPAYWRGLEELADTDEFQLWVEDEFPNRRDLAELDRRSFLKFMGASLALAGLAGCRGVFLPEEKLVPYVHQPEEVTVGKPLYYATAMPFYGYGIGVLVEQREGRPIKLEGNPSHPISGGSLDAASQAQILNFYDPDRLGNVINEGNVSTIEQFAQVAGEAMAAQKIKGGAGLRILTDTVTSPTQAAQLQKLLTMYPQAKWHVYEPTDGDGARLGALTAFGKPVEAHYNLAAATVIVSLDSDFLLKRPDSIKLSRDFMAGRSVTGATGTMNRLYSIESSVTITGATADHRWPVKPSEVHSVAASLAAGLGLSVEAASSSLSAKNLSTIVKDLQANPGSAVVIAGEEQPAEVHALVHAINEKIGAMGKVVMLTAPIDANPVGRVQSLGQLKDDLSKEMVDTLIIIGGDPVYNAPADFHFAEALDKAKFKVHLTQRENDTASRCNWEIPMSHALETWGDIRATDGTISIQQPLIAPLHGDQSLSAIEFLSLITGPTADPLVLQNSTDAATAERSVLQNGYELVRNTHKALDEKGFRKAIYDGVVTGSAAALITAPVLPAALTSAPPKPTGDLELKFVACGKILDGRYANNGWLRELPDQITKITWDNVAQISPATAQQMKIESGNLLEIGPAGASVTAPAIIQPGQPDGVISLTLGYGQRLGGVVITASDATGYNAYPLRTSTAMGYLASSGVQVHNNGGDFRFANVQLHHAMNDRDIIRSGTLTEMEDSLKSGKLPFRFADEEEHTWRENSLFPDQIFDTNTDQWGMTIDLNLCTGCNACVTACQAENNIPVVGKDQVARGREMHWIRIDRYYGPNDNYEENETAAELANPTIVFQPIMCVHCEKAPCEPVCPVAATVHSHEGLNQMVYNRCVGTRYCSDNCPYKVRRFNFLNYTDNQIQFGADQKIPLLRLLNNPDVTVRGRGVMEKCTYCVQRIADARIESKKAGIPIADGAIITACQQACPTKAIVFGNVANPKSKVSKLRNDPRSYLLLEDLNTRPRTSHLARLRNPNPEITA